MQDVLDWFAAIPSWMSPAEWSATAAWVAILFGVAAAWIGLAQLSDARRIRREVAAPYVVAFFESSEASRTIIDFVVRNVGQTAAHDIRVDIKPPMDRAEVIAEGYEFMQTKAIRDGIKMLVPGQEMRFYFDDARKRQKPDIPNDFDVSITAHDSKGRVVKSRFNLDSDWGSNSISTEIHNLHWIGHRVEGIENDLDVIASALKAMAPTPEKKYRDPAEVLAKLRPQATRDPAKPLPASRRVSAPKTPDA